MTQNLLQPLRMLVEQNSYTWNKEGVDAVGNLLMMLLDDEPLDWEVTEHKTKGNMVFARSKKFDPKKPTVLLSGHMDTVFPENWPMRTEGHKLYGPGTLDMKAGLLAIVETVKQLHQRNLLENIMLLLTPDEEDGMVHIKKQEEYYKQADFALVFEEGSLDHAAPKAKERAVVVQRKALSFYDITFRAAGGHNAMLTKPKQRHSAIHEMSRMISDLQNLQDFEAGTLINIGTVEGGISPNSLAEHASMRIDIRFGSKQELARVEKALQKVFTAEDQEVTITVERTLHYPSFDPTEKTHAFADMVIETGKAHGLHLEKQFRSAGSEANWISFLNPDCAVIDGFGVVGTGDHSSKEYFYLDTLQDSITLSTDVVRQLLQGEVS